MQYRSSFRLFVHKHKKPMMFGLFPNPTESSEICNHLLIILLTSTLPPTDLSIIHENRIIESSEAHDPFLTRLDPSKYFREEWIIVLYKQYRETCKEDVEFGKFYTDKILTIFYIANSVTNLLHC